MKKRKPKQIPKEDWKAVDSPAWSKKDFAQARPAREVVPHIVENYRRTRGRPPKVDPKISTTVRFDADIIKAFRATGPGWQTRVNDALRDWLKKRAKSRAA